MKMKRTLSMLLALALGASMSVSAFATSAGQDTETTIPVRISAAATTFDVTVPTSFPTDVDPDTGDTTDATDAKITNNSSGSIVVSQIKVTKYGAWSLADYDTDLRNADVDSNQIGIAVRPVGGRNAGEGGTQLKTTAANANEQTLLAAANDQWVIDAKNDGDTDELTISYDTKVSPVSAALTNEQVASIVVTISWNK